MGTTSILHSNRTSRFGKKEYGIGLQFHFDVQHQTNPIGVFIPTNFEIETCIPHLFLFHHFQTKCVMNNWWHSLWLVSHSFCILVWAIRLSFFNRLKLKDAKMCKNNNNNNDNASLRNIRRHLTIIIMNVVATVGSSNRHNLHFLYCRHVAFTHSKCAASDKQNAWIYCLLFRNHCMEFMPGFLYSEMEKKSSLAQDVHNFSIAITSSSFSRFFQPPKTIYVCRIHTTTNANAHKIAPICVYDKITGASNEQKGSWLCACVSVREKKI